MSGVVSIYMCVNLRTSDHLVGLLVHTNATAGAARRSCATKAPFVKLQKSHAVFYGHLQINHTLCIHSKKKM